MAIRHQLAVYSPISIASPLRGAAAALQIMADPRPALVDLLRQEYDASGVLLTGSGTQALQVAIAMAVQRAGGGDPIVALPAFSCFDVVSAAIGAGVSTALYDLDPETLSPDLGSLKRTLMAGARVAVIAPLYGMPVDWGALQDLANRHDTILIEDAAQGHGAAWRSKTLGTIGDISTLSFGRGKGWTGGAGGAVLVRGAMSLDSSAPRDVAAGKEAKTIVGLLAQWTLGRPGVYGIPHSIPALGLGETTFHPPVAPTTMPRSAAAAVLNARVDSRQEAASRAENARWFLERMPSDAGVRPVRPLEGEAAGYLRLPIRVTGGMSGFDSVGRAMALGIAQSYPRSLAGLAPRIAGPDRAWPGADELAGVLVTLPTHSRTTHAERDEIVQMLHRKPQ
jgi:dTDP-4-amino-4,6-dideoxygalactose transaminase